jgi:hypothetical protein
VGEGAVAVPVAELPGDPRQPGAEHERLGADRRRLRHGLDEAEQQPRMALHRAADVAQDDDGSWPADGPPPLPVDELAAGAEIAAEHRSRGEEPAVAVQLVAPRPPPLEPRLEQVDEPLGVAELGGRHPVELTMSEDLGPAVRVRRDPDALDLALLRRPLVGRGQDLSALSR